MENLYKTILKKMVDNQGPKLWVLNRKYCNDQDMNTDVTSVLYTYEKMVGAEPFSVDAIKDINKYNFANFKKAYLDERSEMLDRDSQDMRVMAIWSFYKNVHSGDILLFVHGSVVDGYYIITGNEARIENHEDWCKHSWQAETHKFASPIVIKDKFGSPFFKLLDGLLRDQILSALKSKLNK